jgi:hypothetical protein
MSDILYFFKIFLLVFGVLLSLSSSYFALYPQKYWPLTKSMLEFRGIKGAKPSGHFYAWVRTSALVQISLGIICIVISTLVIK